LLLKYSPSPAVPRIVIHTCTQLCGINPKVVSTSRNADR
jgi:hypothetical protein